MNNCIFIGRLTADPDIRISDSNGGKKTIARFFLAVDRDRSRSRKAEGHGRQENDNDTDYPRFVAFDHTAELVDGYLRKGSLVAVQSEFNSGSYVGRDGKRHYTAEFIVYKMKFLSPKGAGSVPSNNSLAPNMGNTEANEAMGMNMEEFEGQLSFR